MAELLDEDKVRSGGRTRYYVDGTSVRRQEIIGEPEGEEQKTVSWRVRRNREKALHMTAPYVLILAAAVILAVVLCSQYLMIYANIVADKHEIKELQTSIEELKIQNNALEDSLDIEEDLDRIYEIATEEYGMVYPSEEQVIGYDKKEREYVRQYEDIPTEN